MYLVTSVQIGYFNARCHLKVGRHVQKEDPFLVFKFGDNFVDFHRMAFNRTLSGKYSQNQEVSRRELYYFIKFELAQGQQSLISCFSELRKLYYL